jgi:hypothetical protein
VPRPQFIRGSDRIFFGEVCVIDSSDDEMGFNRQNQFAFIGWRSIG